MGITNGNGNKTRLNLGSGMGMGMNHWQWKEIGLKKTFPHYRTEVPVVGRCQLAEDRPAR